MIKQSDIDALARLMRNPENLTGDVVPGFGGKSEYHKVGKRVLRQLAKDLGETEFKVSSNPGGPAVPGEIILHTPTIYVMLSASLWHLGGVMFRTCKSMKDYMGGPNNWGEVENLNGLAGRIAQLQRRSAA